MGDLLVGPLVRAIHSDGVAIWTEWSQAGEITLTAAAAASGRGQEPGTLAVRSRTVRLGGRYYALSCLTGLQPATWYSYRISASAQAPEAAGGIIMCFRTLDRPDAGNGLRLAYGSCRNLSTGAPDALSAFGSWLLCCKDEREVMWPHLLLLIGDQIYADDRMGRRKQARPPYQGDRASGGSPAPSFEDFARMYVEAWAGDEGVRQVFAVLPTYMIFDDHEIVNAWNISPAWRAHALQQGFERILVDGLAAYWVYQGWGNIGMSGADEHILLALMQRAARSGADALADLREHMRQAVYQETTLQWHYRIPTMPPIFVADVRADRPAILDGTSPVDFVPRIMSLEQMLKLRAWMQEHATSTVVLVSSVPAILPPLIGFAEYALGVRPLQGASAGLVRRLGHGLAARQQGLALRMSFEHWPVYGATWRELVDLLAAREGDLIVLSGDVHFSYAMAARRSFLPARGRAVLYQLVASPFRNKLERRDKRLVRGQGWLKRAIYGGVHTRVLPLVHPTKAERVPYDLLFQNVVALVSFAPQAQGTGRYAIRQVYLGVEQGKLGEVALVNAIFPRRPSRQKATLPRTPRAKSGEGR